MLRASYRFSVLAFYTAGAKHKVKTSRGGEFHPPPSENRRGRGCLNFDQEGKQRMANPPNTLAILDKRETKLPREL
jgi:hypothetical protein